MTKEPIIKIAIAEDHKIFREALIPLIEKDKNLKVLFDTHNGKALLENLKRKLPDILLLDVEMPGIDGKEALRIIRKEYPKLKVIILTTHYTRKIMSEFFKMGVSAFLAKTGERSLLIEAIKTVHHEGVFYDKEVALIMAKELAQSSNYFEKEKEIKIDFTDIELTIIKMVCQNKINKEIADLLNMSVRTVEWHRANVMLQIGSNKVADLIVYAIKHNLVTVV